MERLLVSDSGMVEAIGRWLIHRPPRLLRLRKERVRTGLAVHAFSTIGHSPFAPDDTGWSCGPIADVDAHVRGGGLRVTLHRLRRARQALDLTLKRWLIPSRSGDGIIFWPMG